MPSKVKAHAKMPRWFRKAVRRGALYVAFEYVFHPLFSNALDVASEHPDWPDKPIAPAIAGLDAAIAALQAVRAELTKEQSP